MDMTGYDKQELDSLYTKRVLEEEESIRRAERLKGNMQASMRVIKEKLDLMDSRLIEFYQLKIPKLDGTDSLEDLKEFRDKISSINEELGSKALEYLKTGNVEVLKSLPELNKVSKQEEPVDILQQLQPSTDENNNQMIAVESTPEAYDLGIPPTIYGGGTNE